MNLETVCDKKRKMSSDYRKKDNGLKDVPKQNSMNNNRNNNEKSNGKPHMPEATNQKKKKENSKCNGKWRSALSQVSPLLCSHCL